MELKGFLLKCSYPIHVIEKGIFNARYPAPKPKDKQYIISLVTTNFANFKFKGKFRFVNFFFQN